MHQKRISKGQKVAHWDYGRQGSQTSIGLQRILNERRVPYTGAGATSSELAFDKGLSKKCFVENGVNTPLFEFVSKDDFTKIVYDNITKSK